MIHNFTNYYFLGIGGIGMSAIARFLATKGFPVAGYDRVESKITEDLEKEGIEVNFNETTAEIPTSFLDPKRTLIIITPAVPNDLEQWQYFKENNYTIMKRAEVLGELTKQSKAICIAGTHGKTTTSTMTAHIMAQSTMECNAFLGGIANNYKTNLIVSAHSNYVIVEADEYDRSFHHLTPYMAVITSMDSDHLDIYGDFEGVRESFRHFTSLIKPGGTLILNKKIDLTPNLQKGVKLYTYGIDESADFHAKNIRNENGKILFDFVAPTETIHDIKLIVPFYINVENAVAAIALAWLNGVEKEEIRFSISTFSGIYRRFNIVYKSDKISYIDDYAHHPNELKASISSIRKLYPNKKITGIFQPHLYSRTKDFAAEFATELSKLDSLILLDIYPAREKPIEGVNADLILKDVTIHDKTFVPKENLLTLLEDREIEILVTFGAGDIERLVPDIRKFLKNREKEEN